MDVRAPFSSLPPPLVADFSHAAWRAVPSHDVDRLWNGDPAPPGLGTTARLIWTATDLWLGFECGYTELDVDDPADVDTAAERVGLWDRDVCEAFIRSAHEPHAESYKEFEVAPTGQWCDLAIHRPRVHVDWQWNSGMATASAIDSVSRVWRAVMRLPFRSLGGTPAAGDTWHANLFRIGRVEGVRHYLSYAPTGTTSLDFHVPAAFVPLMFTDGVA
jgi:hypothetical protein